MASITLILLRGLAREQAHWLGFRDILTRVLQTEFAEFDILSLDCLGCGEFYDKPAKPNISELTDQIRAQLGQQGIDRTRDSPLFIVGLSMGGMLAVDWARRFPDEVRGLVLINSSNNAHPLRWRLRWQVWPRVVRALLAGTATREKLLLRIVSNRAQDYGKNLRAWLAIQKRRPVSTKNILNLLRAASTFASPPALAGHGLILTSARDRMVSPKCSIALARQYQWPISIHPQAGHDLTLDDPEWVAQKISTWLRDLLSEEATSAI